MFPVSSRSSRNSLRFACPQVFHPLAYKSTGKVQAFAVLVRELRGVEHTADRQPLVYLLTRFGDESLNDLHSFRRLAHVNFRRQPRSLVVAAGHGVPEPLCHIGPHQSHDASAKASARHPLAETSLCPLRTFCHHRFLLAFAFAHVCSRTLLERRRRGRTGERRGFPYAETYFYLAPRTGWCRFADCEGVGRASRYQAERARSIWSAGTSNRLAARSEPYNRKAIHVRWMMPCAIAQWSCDS